MKKETLVKLVTIAIDNMLPITYSHGCDKVSVNFDTAVKYGLAASVSNCIKYVDMQSLGYKEDLIISYTDYDDAINIWTTFHNKEHNAVLGYAYKLCVRLKGRTQIEIACELCSALGMARQMCKY